MNILGRAFYHLPSPMKLSAIELKAVATATHRRFTGNLKYMRIAAYTPHFAKKNDVNGL